MITDLEIISIDTVNGKLVAILSYKDSEVKEFDLNDGYSIINVPVNIRPLQLSPRGNILVNQSIRQESIAVNNLNQKNND